MNLFTADTRVEFWNFIGLCFLKCKSLEQKYASGVSFCETKGLWKVWAKTKQWFPVYLPPKWMNFFLAGIRVKNLNFLGLIFGKGKLVERKTFTKNFRFLTRKGHEKVGQTESCFPISPSPKNCWISFQWARGWNIQTLTRVLFCDTDTKEPYKPWDNTECCFPYKPPKNWSISFDRVKRVQLWDFIAFFCMKRKLVEPKNHHRSFILRHWKTMQTLG